MPILSRLASTYRTLFRKTRVERDLDDELRGYLELREQELVDQGLSVEQARRTSRLELGGAEQVKERVRDERRGALVDALRQDLLFGARMLRRTPVFTAITVATLATAIGGTTAVVSTVDAALFRPVAYAGADALVAGQKTFNGADSGPVSRLDYFDFRARSRSFDGLAAVSTSTAPVVISGGAEPWVADVGFVTWNLFPILRVNPILGRHFLQEEEAQAQPSGVIISHRVWQTRLGGSPGVVGSTITAFGSSLTVIGVMPATFRFLHDADMWVPVSRQGPLDPVRDSHSHWVVGRLKTGVSLAQAQHDVDAIARALAGEYPATNKSKGLHLASLQFFMVRQLRAILMLLMAAILAVLLIAATNVAGLLLARGQRRLPEMAMRSALGASRWRLVRQLLTESVLLTAVAGGLGIGVTALSLTLLDTLLSLGTLGIDRPPIDGRTLLVASVLSIATGLLVGIVPALRAAGVGPATWLGAGRQRTEGRRSLRLRSAFVVVQVAVSVVLLAASVLFIRNVVGLTPDQVGFAADGVYTARVALSPPRYLAPAMRQAFLESVLADVSALPGVVSAAAINKLPILDPFQDWGIWPANRPPAAPEDTLSAMARWVTPGYFKTMGIPILAGRDISARDVEGAPQVIVISEQVARRLFPGQPPLGQSVQVWSTTGTFEVVGVVGDARVNLMLGEPDPTMYMSSAQGGSPARRIVIRTAGDPAQVAAPLRAIVRARDRSVALMGMMPMTAVVDQGLSLFRVVGLSLGIYSGIALFLTAIGLFGALAYHVSQQESEMSLRLAMGATPIGLLGRVLRRGLTLAGAGLLLGAIASAPSARLLAQLPFTLQAQGSSSLALVLGGLCLVAIAASLIPAWRVMRINPVDALKKE